MVNQDFRDILLAFESSEVEYMIVGAYALAAHGIPRATGDLDRWINSTAINAAATLHALKIFGAPTEKISESDLASEDLVFQIGLSPRRIDILTSISGVSFQDAWTNRMSIELDDLAVRVIGRETLIQNKKATGRPQDLVEVQNLMKK